MITLAAGSRRAAAPARTAFLLVALAAAVTGPAVVTAVPIGDLHQNDMNGVPATPYTIGTPVAISGIVTAPDTVFNRFSTAIHVQDATGGIYVFQSGGVFQWNFDLGDSVTVAGEIAHFLGLTEVTNLTNVVIHERGRPVPAPLVLTCAEVAATWDPQAFREPNEGRLIRIDNVSITTGSWPVNPGGNTTLTVSDGTGTTTLFINQNTNLNGSPAPPTVFSVLGVLQQEDASSPYTTGYRIVPRTLADITGQGPTILTGPTAVDITPATARIVWTTDTASTSRVDYGPTTAYGTTVENLTPVTAHSVLLTGLVDGAYWNYRVSSTDAAGTTTSGNRTFLTPPATDEAILVYFNKPIEPAYAAGRVAAGSIPLDQVLIARINAARFSIDCAMYSFSLSQVADALIAAHQRGVQVRVIREWETGATQYNRLLAAGIPGIDSHFGGNHASTGIHHNKFFVFEARDNSSALDDWVLTGSWNPTLQGTNDDAQNVVEIKDAEVAAAYTIEFNEMWGSSTNVPDPVQSRMGTEKFNNTQHLFTVNSIPVEVYFAPSDGHENIMLARIGNDAHHQIYFATLTLTRDTIEGAMKSKWDNVPGFEVRGVFDQNLDPNTRYYQMIGLAAPAWSPPADVHLGNYSPGVLHHKTMLIDVGHQNSDPLVITGSANWSANARNYNDENQVYIHDYDIARQYLQEFAARYHAAGGTGPLGEGAAVLEPAPAPGATGLRTWSAPNPFVERTQIWFTLARTARARLAIHDVAGRRLRTFDLGERQAGTPHAVQWDGRDARGRTVAPGVYYYRIDAGGAATRGELTISR
jgi:phosphatidylserine/phosphatidylglycerophosphate/cardiolipin synthase-like enzyme